MKYAAAISLVILAAFLSPSALGQTGVHIEFINTTDGTDTATSSGVHETAVGVSAPTCSRRRSRWRFNGGGINVWG